MITMDQDFLDTLNTEKNLMILPRTDTLRPEVAARILESIKDSLDLSSINEAKTVVAVMFQQGGTARGCDGNITISLFNKKFKLASIRKILREEGFNRGERKLARSLASDIQKICFQLEVPGNLFQKISRSKPERSFTLEEQTWLSDFQSTNESAPAHIRVLITESFNNRPLPVINRPKRTGK